MLRLLRLPRDLPLLWQCLRKRTRNEAVPADLAARLATIDGWLTPGEAGLLHRFARDWPVPGPVIELGSYCGKSAAVFADAGRRVLAVDAWTRDTLTCTLEPDTIWPKFQDNLATELRAQQVVATRGKTRDVAAAWTQASALLYVDAGHEYGDVRADLDLWTPFVLPGGVLLMHDVFSYSGVTRAASELMHAGWRVAGFTDRVAAFIRVGEGHEVEYVGLPCPGRPGFDSAVPLPALLAGMSPRPDFYLWIDPGAPYFPLGLEDMPIPTACYLVDVHLGRWRQQAARFFDSVFVAQKDYVPGFRKAVGHEQVHWLPPAAAPDVHRQHDLPRIYDVGFAGNLGVIHRRTPRARRLRLLAGKFRVNDYARVYSPAEVGQLYSQSKVVFNNSINGDVNMRVFEGMAAGGMMLTDAEVNGLNELFEIGREVVVYRDDRDLLEQVAYYLAHEDERARIAAAGRRRVLAEHLYTHRARRMAEVMNAPDLRRCAALRGATSDARWRARLEVYTHLHMVDAVLDDAQEQGLGPLRRAWTVWPCIARRLLRHCMRRRVLPSDTPAPPAPKT